MLTVGNFLIVTVIREQGNPTFLSDRANVLIKGVLKRVECFGQNNMFREVLILILIFYVADTKIGLYATGRVALAQPTFKAFHSFCGHYTII